MMRHFFRPWLAVVLAVAAHGQTQQRDISPGSDWVDTGIDLKPGDTIQVTASGELQYVNAKQANGPEGLPRAFMDLIRIMQLNEAGRGALIGRIGDNAAARPFLLGANGSKEAPVAGHLFITINQATSDQATGSYHLSITKTEAKPAATAEAAASLPAFPQSLLDSLPKRVTDPNGEPGDRVNFILVGTQEQVQAALKAAGWVVVDRTHQEAVFRGILASLSKESYVTLPMSELNMFARAQDFGYAQADPLRVVASRHHFRIWKAPDTLEGRTIWVGAGTHDIGFDRDQRNNGVTHKIDPETDGEREYIRDSLVQTGLTTKTDYLMAAEPIKNAKTATGSEFHSDGRTLIVYLK
jgi:hypothetical protein